MDGRALFGDQDMLAHKTVTLTEVHPFPVETEGCVRKFAAEGGIGEKIADPAFKVDPAVGTGGTGEITDAIKLLQMLAKVKCKGP
jgi:hypothetical protein